mmetsp:Transcript_6132/g.16670  ORF Transcript_6132/g.16670 Transcript_6132/m.16670 type:complete len:307 (-) Transcript_6132:347-1267(-)
MPVATLLFLAAALRSDITRAAAPVAAAGAPGGDATSLVQVGIGALSATGVQRGHSSGAAAIAQWPNPEDPLAVPTAYDVDVIRRLKESPHDMALVNRSVASIALMPVWYVVEVGGYDILFRALRDFANESTVQMQAWRGLSDQSHTQVGSNLIANYGGPNRGIVYMVQQMQAHPTPYEADCSDWLTYKYEVLQCINGLLGLDLDGTRGKAAVDVGLLEQIVYTMRVESDRRPSVYVACNCLDHLLSHDASYAGRLRNLGAVELVEQSIETYSKDDPRPFYFGMTYGQMYQVVPPCSRALTILAAAA